MTCDGGSSSKSSSTSSSKGLSGGQTSVSGMTCDVSPSKSSSSSYSSSKSGSSGSSSGGGKGGGSSSGGTCTYTGGEKGKNDSNTCLNNGKTGTCRGDGTSKDSNGDGKVSFGESLSSGWSNFTSNVSSVFGGGKTCDSSGNKTIGTGDQQRSADKNSDGKISLGERLGNTVYSLGDKVGDFTLGNDRKVGGWDSGFSKALGLGDRDGDGRLTGGEVAANYAEKAGNLLTGIANLPGQVVMAVPNFIAKATGVDTSTGVMGGLNVAANFAGRVAAPQLMAFGAAGGALTSMANNDTIGQVAGNTVGGALGLSNQQTQNVGNAIVNAANNPPSSVAGSYGTPATSTIQSGGNNSSGGSAGVATTPSYIQQAPAAPTTPAPVVTPTTPQPAAVPGYKWVWDQANQVWQQQVDPNYVATTTTPVVTAPAGGTTTVPATSWNDAEVKAQEDAAALGRTNRYAGRASDAEVKQAGFGPEQRTDNVDNLAKNVYSYRYHYKPEFSEEDPTVEHQGPMAQEIEQVYNDVVQEDPQGVKRVDAARLAMNLTGDVANLARRMIDLEKRTK
jgi:hypothetical protein